ncbi:MAG: Arc family DNA-binding protein [Ignavibacteriaceae bacterium]
MAEKKKFLLRIDDKVYAALEKWAADDLRSINSQIEYLLTDALKKSNRTILSSSKNQTIHENPTAED